jgi:NAD(P)H-hydrate epimerase
MIGAPALAAGGALRGGAGLVTVACPASIQPAVAVLCPCATTLALPELADGRIDPARARRAASASLPARDGRGPSVMACGPGLGRGGDSFARALIRWWGDVLATGLPLVLDADALAALRGHCRRPGGWPGTVITPHPGEMARIHASTTRAIQSDRAGWALRTAREMAEGVGDEAARPVVVLKGEGTIVTDGRRLFLGRTGNPGMATGGSGDVLTGVIAALIGQGLPCFDAAVLGVHVHGLAGDIAAKRLGQVSLTASDLVDHLPRAFRRLGG